VWPERLELALARRAPKRIFVNSVSDLLLVEIPVSLVAQGWSTIARRRTFQVLTKLPERMPDLPAGLQDPPQATVWLGSLIENRGSLAVPRRGGARPRRSGWCPSSGCPARLTGLA